MNRVYKKISCKVGKKAYAFLSSIMLFVFITISFTGCFNGASEKKEENADKKGALNKTVQTDKDVEKPVDTKSKVVELNENNFDNTIKNGVVLVDFWAPWCGPCRTQGPIIDELANEISSKAVIAKVNVDKNNAVSSKYEVRNIPK